MGADNVGEPGEEGEEEADGYEVDVVGTGLAVPPVGAGDALAGVGVKVNVTGVALGVFLGVAMGLLTGETAVAVGDGEDGTGEGGETVTGGLEREVGVPT